MGLVEVGECEVTAIIGIRTSMDGLVFGGDYFRYTSYSRTLYTGSLCLGDVLHCQNLTVWARPSRERSLFVKVDKQRSWEEKPNMLSLRLALMCYVTVMTVWDRC